jgi:predicted metalloprotease with PDZ domain
VNSLRHILAHEHQHTWLPTRVGGVRIGPDEPLDYWLSEGFTDFYTLRLLLRSGAYSLNDFVDDYNRILRAYAASPARDVPDRVIAARFWDDRAVADLPYQRGLLLAALWDDHLRRMSHGTRDLDNVVLKMKDDADAHKTWTRHGAPANLEAVYAQLGGGDLSSDVARFVDKGATVVLPADMFGDCATVETVNGPVFDHGFDTAATGDRNGLVTGVDPRGPAYAAGLRNGMRVIKHEGGQQGDPTTPESYRVDDHGVVRAISWLPAGRTHLPEQQIVLARNMSPQKRALCTRIMAGETDALSSAAGALIPASVPATAAPAIQPAPVLKAVAATAPTAPVQKAAVAAAPAAPVQKAAVAAAPAAPAPKAAIAAAAAPAASGQNAEDAATASVVSDQSVDDAATALAAPAR